jgi:hypothetical protein
LLFWLPLCAVAGLPPPRNLNQRAGFDQRVSTQVPMSTHFRAANGHDVTLADLADGKPTLLAQAVYALWLVLPSLRPHGFALTWGDALAWLGVGGLCWALFDLRLAQERATLEAAP